MAAILIAVGCLDQRDHPDLHQILDIDRRGDMAMDVPGDPADQSHMVADQHGRFGREVGGRRLFVDGRERGLESHCAISWLRCITRASDLTDLGKGQV